MQILNVTTLPIYLPYDTAPIPFGDAFTGISTDDSTYDIWTVPGYVPTLNDRVQVFQGAGGTLDPAFTAGTVYYVVSPSTDTFELSATAGGSAISGGGQSTGINVNVISSAKALGPTIPFKPGYTVVVLNLSGGSLTLQGANDSGTSAIGNYQPPAGPGSYHTIATVAANSAALAQLNYDWIRVSTSATLVLLQN